MMATHEMLKKVVQEELGHLTVGGGGISLHNLLVGLENKGEVLYLQKASFV